MKQQGSKNLTIRHPRKSRNSPDLSAACVIQSEFDFPSFQILFPFVWGRFLLPEFNLTLNYVFFYRLWTWHCLSLYHWNLGQCRLLCAVCQNGKYAKMARNFHLACQRCEESSCTCLIVLFKTFSVWNWPRIRKFGRKQQFVDAFAFLHCTWTISENSQLSLWFPAPCQHGLQRGELKSQWSGVMYNCQICLIAGFGLLSLAHMFDHMEKHRCFKRKTTKVSISWLD